jgi:hypothetical protein
MSEKTDQIPSVILKPFCCFPGFNRVMPCILLLSQPTAETSQGYTKGIYQSCYSIIAFNVSLRGSRQSGNNHLIPSSPGTSAYLHIGRSPIWSPDQKLRQRRTTSAWPGYWSIIHSPSWSPPSEYPDRTKHIDISRSTRFTFYKEQFVECAWD